MQLACPHCQRQIEFAGPAPDFCGFCGKLLADDTASREAETIASAASGPRMPSAGSPSREIGPYRLIEQLGQGGMGVVWRAEHVETKRPVALKLLSSKLAAGDDAIERFLREGRMAAALSHPRTTFVLAAGQHDGMPYIAMELMPGATLKEILAENGSLSIDVAVDHILDVVDGLAAAHELGIIHRDVKPSNCFVDTTGRIKIGDFGLSKSLIVESHVTQTGAFMGTPEFTSPEQARGAKVDHRTDIYAVGATLYYLLTGRGPFVGDAVAVIAQISSDAPPPLGTLRADIPPALERIVARTLEKDPARRYQNLAQLRAALEPFSTRSVIAAEPWRRIAAYALDILIWFFFTALTFALVAYFARRLIPPDIAQPLSDIYGSAAGFLYFFLLESIFGRTIGQQLMRLRIVGVHGGTAGWVRIAGRTMLVPFGLGLDIAGSFCETSDSIDIRTIGTLLSFLHLMVMLGCLFTIRKANGYRGLHETATGTRVIRVRRDTQKITLPSLVPGPVEQSVDVFGSFQVTGVVGHYGDVTVYQGQDVQLARQVWLFVSPNDCPWMSERRIALARGARPHWLEGGATAAGGRWDAFQAVGGAPLSALSLSSIAWETARSLLIQLAEELEAAIEDETLPHELRRESIWVEPAGRLKLLDLPIVHVHAGSLTTAGLDADESDSAEPPVTHPVSLFRDLVHQSLHGPILPANVQQFALELADRANDGKTLSWARQWLVGATDQRMRVERRDRAGALAITVLFEFIGISVASLMLPLISTVLIGVLGAAARGSPVFWLMRIDVRRRDGRPASRLRCMMRQLVTWGPYSGSLSLVMLSTPVIYPALIPQAVAGVASIAAFVSGLIMFLGAVYAIWRPHRGLQDLITGTVLVPAASDDSGADPALAMMLPVGRSAAAIAAGYLGIFGIFVPPIGPVAIVVSVWARRTIQPDERGRGRIAFGFVGGVMGTLECVAIAVYAIVTLL